MARASQLGMARAGAASRRRAAAQRPAARRSLPRQAVAAERPRRSVAAAGLVLSHPQPSAPATGPRAPATIASGSGPALAAKASSSDSSGSRWSSTAARKSGLAAPPRAAVAGRARSAPETRSSRSWFGGEEARARDGQRSASRHRTAHVADAASCSGSGLRFVNVLAC